MTLRRPMQHYPSIAETHLCAADRLRRIAIVEMFGESECLGEPDDSFRNVLIPDVWYQGVRRHGTILDHDLPPGGRIPTGSRSCGTAKTPAGVQSPNDARTGP